MVDRHSAGGRGDELLPVRGELYARILVSWEEPHHDRDRATTRQWRRPPVDTLELHPYSKRQQLLQELLNDSELLLKNRLEVRHLMTRDPVVVPPTMTLEEMTALVQQRRLHHLLVCGRGGEVLGVISDRDLHRPARGDRPAVDELSGADRHAGDAAEPGHHLPDQREHLLPAGGR